MLISELITNLEKIKESEGDIEVVTVGEYKDVHRIEFYSSTICHDYNNIPNTLLRSSSSHSSLDVLNS